MKSSLRYLVLAALVLLVGTSAFAQTTATLTGTVKTDGNPLPGATVTISSPGLQGTRVTVTGESGGYVFPSLPPGDYTVRFELEGLQPVTKSARLPLGQTARADADLRVSAVAEAITVTATSPSVLETSQIAANLSGDLVDKLPINRTVLAAALLAPGVNANTVSANQLSISGSPGYDNLVMVNGVVITENVRSQAAPLFIEDAIQETTVLSGAISAEYGRFTGGVVNSITKSGGNQFSGSLRDSRTNPSWTKVSDFGEAKAIDKDSDVYEATLGGFVIKDRLWFFGAGRQEEGSIGRVTRRTNLSYTETFDEKRYEGKLTGQLTPRHSLVGSYLDKKSDAQNTRFTTRIYDLASLTSRSDPESLLGVFYNGVITNNLLVEGRYSQRKWDVGVGGGSQFKDVIQGTLLRNSADGNSRFNSPTFCGVCETETRNNDGYTLKGNYYLNTSRAGAHNLVLGYEDFAQQKFANNHQSGSDFRIFVTDVVRVPGGAVPLLLEGTAVPRVTNASATTYIRWTPIFLSASENNLQTKSVFLNDRWDFNKNFTFNIGGRFDQNNAVDANGLTTSDDSSFSPRLTAIFDPAGNGRNRFTASYNKYVSQIVEGPGTAGESAGSPGSIDFIYGGAPINPVGTPADKLVPAHQALQMIFDWFNRACNAQGQCGTSNLALLKPNGAKSVPGFDFEFPNSIKSPSVREYTLGWGTQIARNGFAKVDLIARDWRDFYNFRLDRSTPVKTDSLGIDHDVAFVENTNEISREYRGIQFQGGWRPNRLNIGLNYTYSTLEGNDTQEDPNSGTVGNTAPSTFYPEYLSFANAQPIGYMPGDVRHRARGWIAYDLPLPRVIGNVNLSVLQSYDSALSYSAIGLIDAFSYAGAPDVAKYTQSQLGFPNYYFSKRGGLRVDDITRTDFSVNYTLPIWKVSLFAQGDLLNAFNEQGVELPTLIDTTVNTSLNSANFAVFNPFTQTPKECPQGTAGAGCKAMGANYQKSATFGDPLTKDAYQLARTYRFSAGIRF